MRMAPFLLSLFSLLPLSANEFPLIQPISVEKAPIVLLKPEPIAVTSKEQKAQEKIVEENKNPDEFAKTQDLDMQFKKNSSSLSNDAITKIMEFAQFLKENKGYQVVLYGYADSMIDKHDNLVLSQKRVNNIQDALVENGISSTRLTAVGKGNADSSQENGDENTYGSHIEALIIK